MDWDYKGWNSYVERHLAIFVNCFLSRAKSSIKSLAREGFSQFMPPYRTITSNEEPNWTGEYFTKLPTGYFSRR